MSCYCPECGHNQSQSISGTHQVSSFAWTYDFVCEKCWHIISYTDWGIDYSESDD